METLSPLRGSLFVATILAATSACGGNQAAETRTGTPAAECSETARPVSQAATFGDLVERAGEDGGVETAPGPLCVATEADPIAIRWAPPDRPRITLSGDAVDVGSGTETVCAWYGRCDAATGQREILDEESVLNTVDCLLESGPPGDVTLRAAREVSAQVLLAVIGRINDAGRRVEVERQPVSFWFPCHPTARGPRRSELPEDVVHASARPRLWRVRRCYQRPRVPAGHAGGQLLLRFTVAADGTVEDAIVAASTLELPEVEQCVLSEVRGWTFPAPGGDGSVVANYPIDFRPIGRRR